MPSARSKVGLGKLMADITACRLCVTDPDGAPLPHEPRPVVRARATARLGICGQAPGARVHASGVPFTDPSGQRLRAWMGVTEAEFYDQRRVAILPMGFCYPGQDSKGGDLPPRKECARAWRPSLMAHLPRLELLLLIGGYAQAWHLPGQPRGRLTETVADWRAILESSSRPRFLPLPHPSWRNTGWLKVNPWFERDVVPRLQREVRTLLEG